MIGTALERTFRGHPWHVAAAALAGIVGLTLFWYLASPLWIRVQSGETAPASAVALLRGELREVDRLHRGSGPVVVLRSGERLLLRFDGVSIQNGPDLHVYLSRESGGTYREASALYLGALKATDGSFNYELPPGTDIRQYRSVVVWCRAFSTLFTWADLTP